MFLMIQTLEHLPLRQACYRCRNPFCLVWQSINWSSHICLARALHPLVKIKILKILKCLENMRIILSKPMHWNTFDVSGIREIERRIKEYLHPQQFLHVKITENPVDARLNSMLKDEKKPRKQKVCICLKGKTSS